MASLEFENVCNYLKNREIQISANNIWLSSCINCYKSNFELRNIYGSLQEYVCVQWLLADLHDIQHGTLPRNCKNEVIELKEKYPVQINWMRDIGQSCYSQLKAIQDSSSSESNENVSADEPNKQSWEPNPKRVLMMEVTDGITCLKAMEYSPIQKLSEPFLPGFKVVLIGPIECRNGILFLKNENIILLGGEVQELYNIHSKENMLSRCLNLSTENGTNENQGKPVSETITNHFHSENILQPRVTHSNPIPSDSRTNVEQNTLIQSRDREMFMDLEDDDFLCQLPVEVLDCQNNSIPDSHELSPVLDRQSPINSRQTPSSTINIDSGNGFSIGQRSPVLINKLQLVTKPKPKLFPSLDDLRSVGKEPNIHKNVTPPPPSRDLSPKLNSNLPAKSFLSSSIKLFDSKPTISSVNTENEHNRTINKSVNNSFGSSSRLNLNDINNKESLNTYGNERIHDNSLQGETEHLIELMDSTITEELKYPELRTVKTRIKSIKKLKIRSSEWFCDAVVAIQDKDQNVTFSNNVLEGIFGISAPKVEVWRGEMANNPSLKKKVNDILKAGQAKLNTLDCIMALEYTSEECTPNVVEIHST